MGNTILTVHAAMSCIEPGNIPTGPGATVTFTCQLLYSASVEDVVGNAPIIFERNGEAAMELPADASDASEIQVLNDDILDPSTVSSEEFEPYKFRVTITDFPESAVGTWTCSVTSRGGVDNHDPINQVNLETHCEDYTLTVEAEDDCDESSSPTLPTGGQVNMTCDFGTVTVDSIIDDDEAIIFFKMGDTNIYYIDKNDDVTQITGPEGENVTSAKVSDYAITMTTDAFNENNLDEMWTCGVEAAECSNCPRLLDSRDMTGVSPAVNLLTICEEIVETTTDQPTDYEPCSNLGTFCLGDRLGVCTPNLGPQFLDNIPCFNGLPDLYKGCNVVSNQKCVFMAPCPCPSENVEYCKGHSIRLKEGTCRDVRGQCRFIEAEAVE